MERKSSPVFWTAVSALATVGLVVIGVAQLRRSRDGVSFNVPVNAQSISDGGGKDTALEFHVKNCDVQAKEVSCALSVVSPRYDRKLTIMGYGATTLTDNDGDRFPMTGGTLNLMLERNQKLMFKMEFPVNKDIVRPATVSLKGYIDNEMFQKSFELE